MQAVSGAGYPGVPSLDILGNVIPFIGDEEPKIETELQKFLAPRSMAHTLAPFVVARTPTGSRSSTATPFACPSR